MTTCEVWTLNLELWINGGPGGNRTLVQTRKPYAFYMLISAFGFRAQARPEPPTWTLSSKSFARVARKDPNYFRFSCTTWPRRFGTRAPEWCPVLSPCERIKVIYCTSITQRERSLFRQIILWQLGFECQSSTHCMLTYHFCPLSNPVKPMIFECKDRWKCSII